MSLSQVVLPELLDQVPQVPLAEDDELVEALVSDRFHETLRVRVQLGLCAGIGTHFTPPLASSTVHASVNTGSRSW